MARFRALTVLLLFAANSGCSSDKPAPTAPSTAATTTGLVIYGAPTASMGVGQTVHLTAVQTYSDGTRLTVTNIAWSSSAPAIASVAGDGSVMALSDGSATITVSLPGLSTSAIIRVALNWTDLDFRVAILNATPISRPPADVQRIFARASDLLFERTGSRMRLIDMRDVGPGTSPAIAAAYLDGWSGEQPDGIVVWSEDTTAVSAGGYSQTLSRPVPYTNRFPGPSGSSRVYVSTIHYEHKYARCGYDTIGLTRISDRSANGECRNQSGLLCVNNGLFWECPGVQQDFYAQPDVFTATTIVHEFMHPMGTAGNNDHYGTSTCTSRTGMSAAAASDRTQSQWNCGQCPDLFLRFRPTGAPSTAGRSR